MAIGSILRTLTLVTIGFTLTATNVNEFEAIQLHKETIESADVTSKDFEHWHTIDFNEYVLRDRTIVENSTTKYYNVPLSEELQDYLRNKCEELGVDFIEALAVMEVESYYQSDLVHLNNNGTKDYGLMQINSIHHDWLKGALGVTEFLNPYQNIDCGVYLLSRRQDVGLHERLMGYNMGSPQTKRLIKQGIYSTNYSRKVEAVMERLKNE